MRYGPPRPELGLGLGLGLGSGLGLGDAGVAPEVFVSYCYPELNRHTPGD